MDTITILIVGVAGLAVVGIFVYILHRSWGDSLPDRIEIPQDYTAPTHHAPQSYTAAMPAQPDEDDDFAPDDELDYQPDVNPDQPVEGLMLITHPLLLETIERSLQHDGPATQYVVQDGDDLYISLDLIKDPAHRRMVAEMIEKFQTQGQVGVWDMITMASTLGRRQ